MTKAQLKQFILDETFALGFDICRVAKADFLEKEAPLLEKWLNNKMHGKMHYMENNFDKRLDPRKLVPGAKTVLTLVHNYTPKEKFEGKNRYKIAKYAYGRDYHKVLKKKLKILIGKIENVTGTLNGRAFVDSAPVMERQWAARSGAGWLGKNSLLLNRSMGSYFFLAEIISDLDLEPDPPIGEYCGTCTKCIEACPTEAIPLNGVVDASKCISYLTIELKDQIPEEFKGKFHDWIFGCDICQDICPWNRFAKKHQEEAFFPKKIIEKYSKKEWEEITQEIFEKELNGSPIQRTGLNGLKRNIEFAK